VVGVFDGPVDGNDHHAFVYRDGVMTELSAAMRTTSTTRASSPGPTGTSASAMRRPCRPGSTPTACAPRSRR
jgi:hypothetical protein